MLRKPRVRRRPLRRRSDSAPIADSRRQERASESARARPAGARCSFRYRLATAPHAIEAKECAHLLTFPPKYGRSGGGSPWAVENLLPAALRNNCHSGCEAGDDWNDSAALVADQAGA